jgi:transglutaminase-like putative cysteine protease
MLRLLIVLVPTVAVAAEPKVRTFRFTYEATVTGLKPGEQAHVWLPVPPTTDDQKLLDAATYFPAPFEKFKEVGFGNEMYHLTPRARDNGTIPLRVVYEIERREVLGETDQGVKDDPKYLRADPLAPPDGKHLKLIEGKKLPGDPMAKGREFYDQVNGLMKYSKEGTEWGRGDVNWVCDSRFGNCTDFHSLFLALCRSQKIPGRFEVGFGIPEKRGTGEVAGYHCWAKFKARDKGWVPVDISEANKNPKLADYYFGNLTADRVTFSTGRGLTLEPKQAGPPLNFFVYPYVEVGGKPHPADKVTRKFGYEDLK